jgi:CPA2 family monovalent cation:H+ antiporter-2
MKLLSQDQYSLILAGSLISITLNPFMFWSIPVVEKFLKQFPVLWKRMDRQRELPLVQETGISNHVVIIGNGKIGKHIVNVLDELKIPCLVVESDARLVEELDRKGVPTLFGDAANSEVLHHAHLDRARLLVITIPDDAAGEVIVAAAHREAPALTIIARASTTEGIRHLIESGAQQVILPELEGGLQIVRRTLMQLGFEPRKIHEYADEVRRDYYDLNINTHEEKQLLQDLLSASDHLILSWLKLDPKHPIAGLTLAAANLRARSGATVVAILREGSLITNPDPAMVLQGGDLVALIGDEKQLQAAQEEFLSHRK